MKRGTPNHPKMRKLAASLNLPLYAAGGVLEFLWHFGAAYARRGDVGRHSDAAIAAAIDWREAPEILVAALVDAGWLDPCPCHRLRIHDWPQHADRAVAKTQEVVRLGWLECYAPRRPEAVQSPGGPAGAGDGSGEEPALEVDGEERGKDRSSVVYTRAARVQHACALPVPVPEPEPTETPPTPRALARRGELSRQERLVHDRDAAVAYWIRLGGRPNRQDRRAVWENLASGRPLEQLLGSIAERVRDGLVTAGRLGPADPWPPPGLAPFDPKPGPAPARASPAELDAVAAAWERVSEALRGRVSPQAWATWIRPCHGLWLREGRLQVAVPGAQHMDWIGRAWTVELQWAAAEAGLEGLDLVMPPARAAGE